MTEFDISFSGKMVFDMFKFRVSILLIYGLVLIYCALCSAVKNHFFLSLEFNFVKIEFSLHCTLGCRHVN
jgi:hypothetical protein